MVWNGSKTERGRVIARYNALRENKTLEIQQKTLEGSTVGEGGYDSDGRLVVELAARLSVVPK